MPDTPPVALARTQYRRLKDHPFEVAVLPWGATEAHNYHLPYGTDIIETERIAEESARIASSRGARTIVLPAVPFGVNTSQLDIPLTINMNPSTQLAVLRDIASSLERQKIPKLVILNGHGGNEFRSIIRELTPGHTVLFSTLNWYTCLDTSAFFGDAGDHAGEMETSLMMYLAPDLVLPLSEAGSGAAREFTVRAFREKWAWTPRDWTRVTADTGIGNPHGATAEKGKNFFAAVTARIADFLVEFSATPASELYTGAPAGGPPAP